MKRSWLTIALVTLISAPSQATEMNGSQVVLTRGGAVKRALESNPEVLIERAKVARSEALAGQADAARWPMVHLDFGVGPALQAELKPGTAVESKRSAYSDLGLDQLSVALGGMLQVIQPLYTFGKIDDRRAAAGHGIRAGGAQVEMARSQAALEVLRLYEGYLMARATVRFLEDVEFTLGRSMEETRARLELGEGDQDVLRLTAATSLARMGLNRGRAGLRQALAGLKAYLGLPSDVDLVIADTELAPLSLPVDPLEELIATALSERPELQALNEGIAGYTMLASAELAGYFPDFFAMAFLSGAYTPGRDLVDTRFVVDPLQHFVPGLMVGFRLSFHGDMPGRRADQMRAEVSRLEATREWLLKGAPAQVVKAYEDVVRARGDLEQVRPGINASKQWIVHASADYDVGLGSSDALTDALESYVALKVGEMDAIYRLNVALAELAKATGTLRRWAEWEEDERAEQ